MSLLNILQFPDPRLKSVAQPVMAFDQALNTLIKDLWETMYQARGIGLAATQVNIQQRVIVVDLSENQNHPQSFINPEIVNQEGFAEYDEGCLSFPGVYAKVKRAQKIELKYRDQQGKEKLMIADGLLSICIQHEIDHLNGITFFDHLSPLKQGLLSKRIEKNRKRTL